MASDRGESNRVRFELTDDDVAMIDGVDQGMSVGPDPDNFHLTHRIPPD